MKLKISHILSLFPLFGLFCLNGFSMDYHISYYNSIKVTTLNESVQQLEAKAHTIEQTTEMMNSTAEMMTMVLPYGSTVMATAKLAAGEELSGADVGYAMAEFIPGVGFAGKAAKGGKVVGTVAKKATTVLGHYPEYVKLSESIGARRFQIPTSVWNKMSTAEQWTANTKFLDRMILRGDNVRLATPLNQVKPGSFFQKELNYLFDKGYRVSSDGLWLVK